MSDAPTAPPDPTPESIWAKPVVSVVGMAIFGMGYLIAFATADQGSLGLFAGAAIVIGSNVVNYWLGSSAGSTKKDATMAALATSKGSPP